MPTPQPDREQDWEWLKEHCFRYTEAETTERETILAKVRAGRPDLAFRFEQMVAELREDESRRPTHELSWMNSGWKDGAVEEEKDERPLFQPGDRIDNRYLVRTWVGRGGMGEVYEVSDEDAPNLGRVALKTIRNDMAGSRQAAARFERETRNALSVTHRNVCRIYYLGRHVDRSRTDNFSLLFLTMEYLAGITLAEWLKERNVRENPVPEREALPLIRQIAAGLAAIHAAKIIHRDLKPGNVMLVGSPGAWRPVITDFGLSRMAEEGDANTTHAAPMGTLGWMAPEQLDGQAALTPAADIYALGLTLHEMLTGRRYKLGTRRGELTRAPVSRHLKAIVRRCLEPEPEARFTHAGQLLDALETEPGLFRRKPLATGVAACIAATAIGGFVIQHSRATDHPAAERSLLERASTQLLGNSFHEASQTLDRALAMAPHDSFAHATLAYAYTNLDLTGKANTEILKAMDEGDLRRASREEQTFVSAVRSTMARDYTTAATQFRRYYDDGDQSARPERNVFLGRALELAQRNDDAEKAYKSAGNLPAALMLRGVLDGRRMRVTESRKEFDDAMSAFRTAHEFGALDAADLQLAATLYRWGQLPEAIGELNTCVQQAMQNGDQYGELRCKQMRAVIALDESRTDKDDAATQTYLEDLARETGREGFQELLGRTYLTLGQVLVHRGNYAAAEARFADAMRLAKSEESQRLEAQVDYAAADTHNRSDRPADAEAEARRALAFYDHDHSVREIAWSAIVLARALSGQGRFDEAMTLLRTRQQQMPDLAPAEKAAVTETIGMVYAGSENYPAALAEYQKAIRLAAGDPAPDQLLIAEAETEMGELAEAQSLLTGLARRRGLPGASETDLQCDLATVNLYQGHAARAEMMFPPGNGEARPLLGVARIRAGKISGGISLCADVLKSSQNARVRSEARLCLLEGFARQKI